jgi:hypothetical protein
MVSRFFDVHVARDNGALLRLYAKLSHYEPLSNDENLRRLIRHVFADHYVQERLVARGMKATEDQILARLDTDRTFSALIDTVYGAVATENGKSRWGYKRASLARMTGRNFNELFPTARFVHIIRDAREVALSMRRSRGSHERNWHFGAVDWTEHVEAGRQLGREVGPGRYHEMLYERVMADPAGTLTELLDFSGAGPDREARVATIRAEVPGLVKSGNTEKWRTLVPAEGIWQIERAAGPLLRDLGYPLVHPDIAGAPVGRVELAWLSIDRLFRNVFQAKMRIAGRYQIEMLKERWRARFGA